MGSVLRVFVGFSEVVSGFYFLRMAILTREPVKTGSQLLFYLLKVKKIKF